MYELKISDLEDLATILAKFRVQREVTLIVTGTGFQSLNKFLKFNNAVNAEEDNNGLSLAYGPFNITFKTHS
jgi:hypothetical protein